MSAISESGSPILGLEAAWAAMVDRPKGGRSKSVVERLYAEAHAEKWRLDTSAFAEALRRSAEHHLHSSRQTPQPAEVESYLESLHLEDLALACACAEGNEAAWEHFVREFRPVLYAAARAIAGESAARDLADSLYAEFFGVSNTGAERKSLFRYFHGRSKLSTWLRAVLAQRHVDVLRAARRTESLDDGGEPRSLPGTPRQRALGRPGATDAPDPERTRYLALLQAALTTALAALEPRDRLRLSYYYVQDLTLAQIGRLLGEHEATVSRKLDRTRRDLRKEVESALANDPHRLSEAQLQLCFEYAREEWPFDLTGVLSRGSEGSGDPAGGGEIK